MYKYAFIGLLAMLSTLTHAGVIDKLKSTPASTYDVGITNMRLASYMLGDMLKLHTKGKEFKLRNILVDGKGSGFLVRATYYGRLNSINEDGCNSVLGVTKSVITPEGITKMAWPNLSENEILELANRFEYKVEILALENPRAKYECH